jgi:voltage-gated potassium channel
VKRGPLLIAAAAAATAGWGALFSATQHVSMLAGCYWALTTATTVGYGDVTVRGDGGRLLAMAVMLTAIPLLAAAFGQIHLDRVKTHLDRHHQALHDRLDEIGNGGTERGG